MGHLSRIDGRRRRQSGVTLLEIMLSLAVVLVGMLALFRVLSVASKGTARGQRFIQAQARAQQVMENIRTAMNYPTPLGANIANCLLGNTADQWTVCEVLCRSSLPVTASPQSCLFVSLTYDNQNSDGSQQVYVVVPDPTPFQYDDHTSWVAPSPFAQAAMEIQVTIGWNEDTPLNPTPVLWPTAGGTPQPTAWHAVTLHAATLRSP